MTAKFQITGVSGDENCSIVDNSMVNRGKYPGLAVYSERRLQFDTEVHPFLNDTLGAAMNQAVTFGSIASVIHSGGSVDSAGDGIADGDTVNELVDSGASFNSSVVVGMVAYNFTDELYARVTAVTSDTRLTFATDLFPLGTEVYVINKIWTAEIIAGMWNFNDSFKVTLTNGNNNDEATFFWDNVGGARQFRTTSVPEWDLNDFTAFRGEIDLDTYNPSSHDFTFQFALDGVAIGNSVSINSVIDTGNFAEQPFVIPLSSFGLSGEMTNGLILIHQRSGGGAKATVKFDNFRLEVSGIPLEFRATVELGHRFHVQSIRFSMADALALTVTDGTTHGLAYDKLLGLSALTNGIIFRRVQNGVVKFSATLKQLSDFLSIQSVLSDVISDGTNTFISIDIPFSEPIILDGSTGDYLSLTIQDDLSGLLLFTGNALGSIEV